MAEVMTAAMPHRLLGLADWEALEPDEAHRIECSEGVLLVAPRPFPQHQVAASRLVEALNRHLPPGLMAVTEVEVLLAASPLTVRAPDVLVTTSAVIDANPPRLTGDDVRLVAEVMSEGSRRTDRVTKMSEYAEAGIDEYWIVDLDPPISLAVHRLHPSAGYRLVVEHRGRVDLTALGAVVPLDLDWLTASR